MRARFRHAAFTHAPIRLSRGWLAKSPSVQYFRKIERSVYLPDLPDGLDGLRITHLSDLHIGSLVTPDALPRIIRVANRFKGDLIAVTGDLVDLSVNVLDPVIDALKQLSAPLGVYLVPGNHDYLDDGPALIRRVINSGLRLMINEWDQITHNDCRITVAGIDYAAKPGPLDQLVRKTLHHAPHPSSDGIRLLLSHHPHAFDSACDHKVDLTLAGHTHGGQFVFSNGKKGSIGLGNLAFRYPQGLYRRGDHYLYVTSGVGSWFPLRIKCPPEIVCITLRSGPEPAG